MPRFFWTMRITLLFGLLSVPPAVAQTPPAPTAPPSQPPSGATATAPVTTGVQKATRQVAILADKQSVSAKIPMNGMLYITPELRYVVESTKVDPSLRIMFQAAEGIIINHVGTQQAKAKLVLRLADGRTVTINATTAANKKTANYLVIR